METQLTDLEEKLETMVDSLRSYVNNEPPPAEIEMFECDGCGEIKPVEGSETSRVANHVIDGRVVAVDEETGCADCVAQAEAFEESRQESNYSRSNNSDLYYDWK